ncbi:MAG: DAK2 domain-containing protein [Lachnospiraceae bacterium]|nr:DAK2 domain-containing protein [Lachnospiraceae bacterium]
MMAKMFLAGAKSLEAQKEYINELNVFPVPDGDTGTNMTMTIMSAAKEVSALEDMTMATLAKAISSGSLRGARGNSGVILSQLLRGFTKVIREYEELDVAILTNAMQKAVETAYKAVMKPKEGTILTVSKAAADKGLEIASTTTDLNSYFSQVIEAADQMLQKTPDMLPVLKQAGVVDSGGQGLLEVLKGGYLAFQGKEIDLTISDEKEKPATDSYSSQASMDIKFGYCTEFIIMLDKVFNAKNENDLKTYLESIGDSIVCVADGDIVKVHVHTNDPGLAIQKALTYGALTNMKIDNMREEHQEKLFKMSEKENGPEQAKAEDEEPVADDQEEKADAGQTVQDAGSKAEESAQEVVEDDGKETVVFHEPPKEMGFIAVSVGEGMDEIFKGLGVDYLIQGGQTMNPSTDDILKAVEHVNAKNVFILPNNKNIILAANQARFLVEDKKVIVIPTKTVPQGITALINFMGDKSVEENESVINEEIRKVKTGQVTYAVRDTVINDLEIKQGNIMGIGDHDILAVGTEVEKTALEMLKNMVDDESELICIYYGEEVDEEIAGDFLKEVEETFPDCDVEIHSGGQPIYYYVISVE